MNVTRRTESVVAAAVETLESRRLLHAPAIDAIPDYTVPVGNTLQIPLTAEYDHADPLVWTVTDNSGAVTTQYRSSRNTFIEMQVQGYADPMVFQLFDDVAPDTVRRIKGLINAGFYDGLTFHRIINDFVIQGGDPAGTGGGDVGFSFNDEFDPNVAFTGDGQLAMANSGKDTNGSQFFITEADATQGPPRFLTFNHTIFGQLVRGFNTRDAISDVSVDGQSRPNTTVRITRVSVVQNTTDAVLQIKLSAAATGQVTVAVTGEEGTDTATFNVTGVTDSYNEPPILTSTSPVYYTPVNTAFTLQLTGIDAEGDPIEYNAQLLDAAGIDLENPNTTINTQTGVMTLVPKQGFVGKVTFYVGVKAPGANSRGSTQLDQNQPLGGIHDVQLVTLAVGEGSIRARTVALNTISGASTTLPVATFTSSDPADVAANFAATVNWGDGSVTTGTIRKSGSRYVVYGTHAYAEAVAEANYPITVDIVGDRGAYAQAQSVAYVRPLANVNNGVLYVHGTTLPDSMGVGVKGSDYHVTVNRVTKVVPIASASSIQMYGFEDVDLMQVGEQVTIGSYIDGGDGDDHLYGGSGPDIINGAAGNDTIFARDGYDRVAGAEGNDTISGGNGKDRLFGQDGNDYIWGDLFPDIISGGAGNDTLIGGSSNDTIYGDEGNDIINGLNGADYLDGGPGTDQTVDDDRDTRIAIEVLV